MVHNVNEQSVNKHLCNQVLEILRSKNNLSKFVDSIETMALLFSIPYKKMYSESSQASTYDSAFWENGQLIKNF